MFCLAQLVMLSESDTSLPQTVVDPEVELPVVGMSRSAKAARATLQAFKSGEFEVDDKKLKKWRAAILRDDPDAEFYEDNIHKLPYDGTRWRNHIHNKCPLLHAKPTKAGGTSTLLRLAAGGWKSNGGAD
ncbi:hypothetical protein B0H10DRAFT_1953756 [Mycena sp. CBHHK59/15]|nr:hypothetical protein B0H10DRAFT_1953756 [Mycena sp. CBHHK59/15]